MEKFSQPADDSTKMDMFFYLVLLKFAPLDFKYQYSDHVRTSEQPPVMLPNSYWLPLPILKENEAADTIFLEKSGCPVASMENISRDQKDTVF